MCCNEFCKFLFIFVINMNILLSVLMSAAGFAAPDSCALVTIPVACIREEPRHASQLVSQALMGTPMVVTSGGGEWLEVETPDGYRGYVNSSSVVMRDHSEWISATRGIVTSPRGCLLVSPADGSMVVDLPMNSIVELTDRGTVLLPDGREGLPQCQPLPFADWAQKAPSGEGVVSVASSFMGAPYLWGGMSGSAMDCSGLVCMSYFANGVILRRDAWMQAEESLPIDAPAEPGDLIFFDRNYDGRIDHVAIYVSGSRYVHSSGMVKINALDPAAGDTITGAVAGYGRPLEGVGYILVKNHPLYF